MEITSVCECVQAYLSYDPVLGPDLNRAQITLFAIGPLGLGPSGAPIFEFVESGISKTVLQSMLSCRTAEKAISYLALATYP